MPYRVLHHSDLMEMSGAEGVAESLADSMTKLEQTGYRLHTVLPNIGPDYDRSMYIFHKPETGAEVFDRYAERFK